MALVVFIRGINVGGHRRFRPSLLAQDKDMERYDVVNVGAAGTFVVHKPIAQAKLREQLLRKLPFAAEVAICTGRALLSLVDENPFQAEKVAADTVRFVSVLSRGTRTQHSFPLNIPASGEYLVRVLGRRECFVFGIYRRRMKTIGCLGQLDKLFGAPVITRNWNTLMAVAQILRTEKPAS